MSHWIDYNDRRGREEREDVNNQADTITKNGGKGIVGFSSGGGAETIITGNHLTDINITINLNVSEKVDPESIKILTDLLTKIQEIKEPQPPVTIIRDKFGRVEGVSK